MLNVVMLSTSDSLSRKAGLATIFFTRERIFRMTRDVDFIARQFSNLPTMEMCDFVYQSCNSPNILG